MSTTVDSRVVEMRFDNKQFEANVSNTMSTLDKLKQKLGFKGATTGLENVGKAANNVNMSGLGSAVETVRTRFSALEVMGVTALANITNSAVNAGKRMLSALTIDPVKTGFSEYELKMDSVRTIMASTGEDIKKVNDYLDELNTYSDETIYSFSDMTQNIGKFTNAGVKLEDAVLAIKGISNEAAVSGANANEASRAMYNFAQALSAGHVKLIDWKSIELANMATKEFKEQLLESAVACGTLTKTSDGMYKTLEGKTLSATKNFNDTLQDEWMTTEVLIGTLKDYADENTEIGKKAKAAAQDVTKLTQVFDILKETAQSGWARTWELIFGDINQAKAVFTPLKDFLSDIIDRMSEWRNDLLAGALGRGFGDLKKKLDNLLAPAKKTADAVGKVVDAVKDYGTVVDDIIGGKWGNGQDRWNKLAEAGYDWAHAQNLVNEKLGNGKRHATDYKEAQDAVNKSQEKGADAQKNLSKEEAKRIEQLANMSEAQLKNLGYTDEQIKSFKELKKTAEKLGIPISELITKIDEIDGRWLLINSFKNIGKGIVDTFKAMKKAWQEIFPPKSIEERSEQLFNFIAGVHKLTSGFAGLLYQNGKLTSTGDKLVRTLKGVFAIVDILTTIFGGAFKIAFKIVSGILGYFNLDLLSVTALIGDAIVKFRDWMDSSLDFAKIFGKIVPLFKSAIKGIGDWIAELKKSDNIPRDLVLGIVNGLKSGLGKIWEVASNVGKTILDSIKKILGIHSPSTEGYDIGVNFMQGLINGIKFLAENLWAVVKNIMTSLVKWTKDLDFGTLLASVMSIGLTTSIMKIANTINALSAPLDGLGSIFEGTGKILSKAARPIKKILNSTAKVVKSFSKVMNSVAFSIKANALKNIAISIAILVGAIALLTFFDTKKLWNSVAVVAALAAILVALMIVTEKMTKASIGIEKGKANIEGFKTGLLGIAGAILLLAVAVKLMGSMDPKNAIQGFIGLAGLVAAIAIVFAAFGHFVKKGSAKHIDKAGKMISKMASAILLLTIVAKILAGMSWGDMGKAAAGMAGLVGVIVLLMMSVKLLPSNVDDVGPTLLKVAAAMLILTVVAKIIAGMSWSEMGKAGAGLAGLVGVITLLMLSTRLLNSYIDDVGPAMLKLAAAMLILAITAKIIAGMSWAAMGKAAVGLAGLVGIVALLMLVANMAKNDAKVTKTLLALAGSIAILALVATLLGFLSIKHLAKGIIAVGLLSAMMALMVYATKDAKECMSTVIAMSVAIGIMAAAIGILSFVDPLRLAGATVALSVVMAMFAFLMEETQAIRDSKDTLIIMAVVIGLLGAVLITLSCLPVDKTLAAAGGLSAVLLALSTAMMIISKAGGMSKNIMVSLGVMAAVLALLGYVIKEVGDLPAASAIGTATALSTLLLAMSAALHIISKVKNVSIGALASLAVISIIVLILGEVLKNVGGLPAESTIGTAIALSTLLLAMSGVCAIVSMIPASAAATGALGLAAFIGIMAGVLAALGGLSKIEGFNELIADGGATLAAIGYAIGDFVGSIIGGFGAGLTSGLPEIGENLAGFAENIKPFIECMKTVDDSLLTGVLAMSAGIIALTAADLMNGIASFLSGGSSFAQLGEDLSGFIENAGPFIEGASKITPESMAGAKALADMILTLTAADLLSSITSWITGGSSITDFAEQLTPFGEAMVKFSSIVTGNIDEGAVMAAANAGKIMADMASTLPNSGGVFGFFAGENDMGVFTEQLIPFAEAMVAFSSTVAGNINEEAVMAAANAGKTMAEMAKTLPNSGGVVGFFMGENDMDVFGEQLVSFGESMVSFSSTVAGNIDAEAVNSAANAGKTMAELASTLPNSGGVVSWFTGDNDIKKFGKHLISFGESMVDFSDEVSGKIDAEAVTAAANAGKTIAELANTLPNSGGIVSWFTGDNDLESFGEGLKDFGKAIKKFSDELKDVSTKKLTTATENISEIVDMMKKVSKLDSDGVKSFGSTMKTIGKSGIEKFLEVFDGAAEDAKKAGKTFVSKIKTGVTDSSKTLKSAFTKIVNTSKTAVRDKYQDFYDAGKYLVTGFAAGITDNAFEAAAKARAMAKAAVEAAEDELGIQSPSKVGYGIGRFFGMGFVNALDDYGSVAYKSSSSMAEYAKNGLTNAVNKIKSIMDSDMDSQPTIRPVLDLSDVESGASRLGGMLAFGSSIGVRANVGTIAASMAGYQNGSNSEVVSAINKLRKDLGNVGNTTYSINGITYDDGSNIANAMEAIVRQAIVERRI